ncbi:DUF779 domain-containing protein [Pradoshia eiseniae]|uniref:DUF779 domain-containing protein n=1 Tax=Pradoshia eiseniae TaxID=2064768 RepID=A0A2S7MYE9_9BACI|nr:DUF779 domain-containing protein [Pradoshia eiseniae]PQD94832.1 DUF779 domain-containing protein [Pradoshia eiseniae]
MAERVIATDTALKLIEELRNTYGSIFLYQSGGCCDGSAPMCYREDDFRIGNADLLLGIIGGVPFYIHESQYAYWKHTQLIIDAIPGKGAEFSLDSIEDRHFITRSQVLSGEQ